MLRCGVFRKIWITMRGCFVFPCAACIQRFCWRKMCSIFIGHSNVRSSYSDGKFALYYFWALKIGATKIAKCFTASEHDTWPFFDFRKGESLVNKLNGKGRHKSNFCINWEFFRSDEIIYSSFSSLLSPRGPRTHILTFPFFRCPVHRLTSTSPEYDKLWKVWTTWKSCWHWWWASSWSWSSSSATYTSSTRCAAKGRQTRTRHEWPVPGSRYPSDMSRMSRVSPLKPRSFRWTILIFRSRSCKYFL